MKWACSDIIRALGVALVCADLGAHAGAMDAAEEQFVMRNYAAALSAYQTALASDLNEQNRAQCWYMIGQCYLVQDQPAKAREAYSTVVTKYGRTGWAPLANVGMGDALFREGKFADAIRRFGSIGTNVVAGLSQSSVCFRLARAYRALKNTAKAATYEQEIRAKYPDSLEARILLSGQQPAAQAAAPAPKAAAKYAVQESVLPAGRARDHAAELKKKGYDAYAELIDGSPDGRCRVLIGRFQGREAAEALLKKVKQNLEAKAFIVTVRDD